MSSPVEEPCQAPPRVALLFTRYPVATETFLQREVEALRKGGGRWDVLVLWPAPDHREGDQAARTFGPWRLLVLPFWLIYWTLRRPEVLQEVAEAVLEARRPNFTNFTEMLLGCAYGLVEAHHLKDRYDHFHAVWASAPATAAWVLSKLTGRPYSMAGHAYDIFENGGDGLLPVKIPGAQFIRTSTTVARNRWIELGARPEQMLVIRRGLGSFPPFKEKADPLPPYRLLCVGRMVEKMGFFHALQVFAELEGGGFPFSAVFVGDGPFRPSLEAAVHRLGLGGKVVFTGALPYQQVERQFAGADLFLFTGKVARSGDRAGFPNAVGEAMAWGVPVCATPVGAVEEGIRHGETGLIAAQPAEAAARIRELLRDSQQYHTIRAAARLWVEREFDVRTNLKPFAERFLF